MAKFLKEVLKHTVTKKAADLGGYTPKAGDEEKFVKKHDIETHTFTDPAIHDIAKKIKPVLTKPEEKRHKDAINPSFKKVSVGGVAEAKETDTPKCNNTAGGVACPVHGIKECNTGPMKEEEQIDEISAKTALKTAVKRQAGAHGAAIERGDELSDKEQHKVNRSQSLIKNKYGQRGSNIVDRAVGKKIGYNEEVESIEELSTDLLHRAAHKAAKVAMTDVQGRSGPIFKKRAAQANKFRAKGMEQEKKEKAVKEETIDEVVVKKSMSAKDKKALQAYTAQHRAKLAAHDTGIGPIKKSFKDFNNDQGTHKHEPSKMGLRHAIGAGYYKNEEVEVAEAMTPKQKAHSHRTKTAPGPKGFVHDPSSNFEAPMHKVEVKASKDGINRKIMHHLRSKDKHSAVFDSQLHYHKKGYKVHSATHKGTVKESDTPITFPNKTSDNALGQNI